MLESIFLTLSTRLAIGNLYKEIVRHIVDEYPRWARWAPFRRQCELRVVERFFEGVSCAFEDVDGGRRIKRRQERETRSSVVRYGKRFTGGCSSSGVQVLVNCPTFTVIAKGGNLGQENPQITFKTEDFPEEFAVDADMESRASLTSRRRLRWSGATSRLTNREGFEPNAPLGESY